MQGFVKKISLSIVLACSLFFVFCSNSELYSESSGDDFRYVEWTWVPYDSDLLRISGRTNYEKGDFVVLSWSASSVTVAFVGTALEAKIWTNDLLYLDVFLDEEENPSSLIKTDYSGDSAFIVPVVSSLPYGKHVVTLYKRIGSNLADWYFYGFRVLGRAEKELLPKPFDRKIEFVGNSIACGSDVLIPDPEQESDLVYESAYYSYVGQTARILKAEAHNICSGGHGVYINYDGSTAQRLPIVYNRTGTQALSAVAWDHDKWHPDAVVINLGTNDFASGRNDSAHFVDATVDFVRHIRSYHPSAKIVLLDGPMLTGDFMIKCRQYLEVAKKVLEGEGVKDLYRFSFDPRGESLYGVYFHPTKDEALADAESLSAWMRLEFGWD